MNKSNRRLEAWSIFSKLFLLVYIIGEAYFLRNQTGGWVVFTYLIYLGTVFGIFVIQGKRARQLAALLTAGGLALAAWLLPLPLLGLLLPASLMEFAESFKPRGLALIPLVLAAWLLPDELKMLYAAAAGLCWLGYILIRSSGEQLDLENSRSEALSADLQRVSRALNENREYAKQSEYTVKLEERNRLSQQIHDEIGHSMAGALIQMEAAKRLLAVNPEKAAELLGNAITISKEGLEQIRLTLKDMKPRSEELGIHRLRLFVEELTAKHTLKASLTHEGNLDLITPLQWKTIQGNATEAVTNTIKYAAADAVHIHIQVLNRLIKAQVADNGSGADKIVKGLGIIGMEERAAALGGTVVVDGSKGFSVITLLPLESGRDISHGL